MRLGPPHRPVAMLLLAATVAVLAVPIRDTTAAAAALAGPSVAAGRFHTLALRGDGTVWAFGDNQYGQLGIATNSGTTLPNPTPTQIPGLSAIVAIAGGHSHSLAVRADGTVWSWGWNGAGQLGRSANDTPNPTPAPVAGLTAVVAVAAGAGHSLALRRDGTVWAFGDNFYGQLGITGGTTNPTPAPVPGLSAVVAIAAGMNHSLALRADGSVWAFGSNQYGQLGILTNYQTLTANPTPTRVPGLSSASAIAAGNMHSLVLRADRTVWAFGSNNLGQLGLPTDSYSSLPVPRQIAELSGVTAIAAGAVHSLALRADGSVSGWGEDTGQLGPPMSTDPPLAQSVPAVVAGLPTSRTIAAGGSHSLAWRDDGSLWAFGNNFFGQLGTPAGNGATDSNIPTPTPVPSLNDVAPPLPFTPLVPARLLDTRTGAATIDNASAGQGPRAANSITQLQTTGRGNIAPDATAAIVNITVTQPQAPGYLTVWPCGEPQPNASNLNFTTGQTIANTALVKTGTVARQ